jgi:hypothetical protein
LTALPRTIVIPAAIAAMIAKDLIIAKDSYTYSIIILRQEKILLDHQSERQIARDKRGWRVIFG